MTSRRSEAAGRPCLSRHQERQDKAAIPTNFKSGLMMLLLQEAAGGSRRLQQQAASSKQQAASSASSK